ncbi:MAG: ABC transporter permease [Tepidisphaeraceae bacterium]
MSLSVSQLELTKPLDPIPDAAIDGLPELVIRPRKGWIAVDWRELWTHRELLYFLVWRDVKVRYKQATLGIAWAVLAPVMSVLVFTLIFGRRNAGFVDDLPPGLTTSLFIFAGMIPWLFISQAISNGGLSLVNQQNLLSKIYMPRLFIPASTIGSGLVDMFISFGVFFVWMLCAGYVPSPQIVLLPLLVLLTVLLSMGCAFTLSAMTVTYRDLRFLIPFITQIGMWLSAVVYPYKSIFISPETATSPAKNYEWLLLFNPFFGIIDAFRSCMFAGWGWRPWHLLSSIIWTIAILVFGLFYFRKTERRFADIA